MWPLDNQFQSKQGEKLDIDINQTCAVGLLFNLSTKTKSQYKISTLPQKKCINTNVNHDVIKNEKNMIIYINLTNQQATYKSTVQREQVISPSTLNSRSISTQKTPVVTWPANKSCDLLTSHVT